MVEHKESHFSLKVPRHRNKANSNNQFSKMSKVASKPMLSHLESKENNYLKVERPPSPIQSLGLRSRLQESIIIESDG